METERWTMVELVARVAAALDGATYAGAPNGRVRDVPDARAIRWYATIGLVDRPVAMRGRTALYGPRHLLQLVAVKRRQAQGLSIAEIQAELAGAPDDVLREFARIPDDVPAEPGDLEQAARPRFWAERAPVGFVVELDPPALHADGETAAPDPVVGTELTPPPGDKMSAALHQLLTGIPLGGGAVLLVPSTPQPADLPAIARAARPLMDVLFTRGLVVTVDLESMFPHLRSQSQSPSDDDSGTAPSTHHSTDSRTDATR